MSSNIDDPARTASATPEKKDKKSKREKGDHKSKKRHRDAEAQHDPEEEPKHKRSKSQAATIAESESKAEKKSKKNKGKHQTEDVAEEQAEPIEPAEEEAVDVEAEDAAERKRRKKEKKEKKEKRRKELELDHEDDSVATSKPAESAAQQSGPENEDAMDIDTSPSKTSNRPFGKLPSKPYPFFTQRVSQYLPLYPLGMIEPIEGYADQHLKPLLNHYVPTFKGVLLGYHELQLGEAPGKGSITEQSEMADEAVLESIDEYGVAFGWLTAKVDLFRPSRGAWLEGSVNLQTEGHLGVVCWGMFNASIEVGRLPQGWRWVNLLGNEKSKGSDQTTEEAELPTPEPAEEGEDVTQLHTTGYWVDENGQRVRGTIRFQIKNFEVGVSGDYGYLSIEGTMLSEDAEKEKVAEEMENARRRKLRYGGSRKEYKRLPEFSMTKFGADEEKDGESKDVEV